MISATLGTERPREQAFNAMVERHSTFCYNVALRMLGNSHDANDAVQDALLSAYRAFARFEGRSRESTWLYRIVVNACLMRIRKNKRHADRLRPLEYDVSVAEGASYDPEKGAMNGELHRVLERGIAMLPGELRGAVVLRDVQGLTTQEAAEVLGLSAMALKMRLHRGRLLLRDYLKGYLAPASGWRQVQGA